MRYAAEEVGVRLVRDDIRNISQDEDSVRAAGFRARYLAAANGLHSPIRRDLGTFCAGREGHRVGDPSSIRDTAVDGRSRSIGPRR